MVVVDDVYRLTSVLPKEEVYGLTSQMRRAAISIPSNIAEGYGRGSDRAYGSFVRISRGSLYELRTLLTIATSQGLLTEEQSSELSHRLITLSKAIDAFASKLAASSKLQAASNLEND